MLKHEWRLLFVRRRPDAWGRSLFILLHVPLLFGLYALFAYGDDAVRLWTVVSLGLFHGDPRRPSPKALGSPGYALHSALSRTLIYAPAAFAALHLAPRRLVLLRLVLLGEGKLAGHRSV